MVKCTSHKAKGIVFNVWLKNFIKWHENTYVLLRNNAVSAHDIKVCIWTYLAIEVFITLYWGDWNNLGVKWIDFYPTLPQY